jgi:hypothetical protein
VNIQATTAKAYQCEYNCNQFDYQQQSQESIAIAKIGQVALIFGTGSIIFGVIKH